MRWENKMRDAALQRKTNGEHWAAIYGGDDKEERIVDMNMMANEGKKNTRR